MSYFQETDYMLVTHAWKVSIPVIYIMEMENSMETFS